MAETVAQVVVDQFGKLPKRGRPCMRSGGRREWTVLAGIVQETPDSAGSGTRLRCVALGTGLKCLPESLLVSDGSVVNDSHAEVVCRRNFQRYLMNQSLLVLKGKPSPVVERIQPTDPAENASRLQHACFKIKDGVRFHMYISQSPCGDASMRALDKATASKAPQQQQPQEQHQASNDTATTNTGKRKHDDQLPESSKRLALSTDSAVETALTSGHVLRGRSDFTAYGKLRTKPSRPDAPPTASLSCSDKMAKWTALGLGGALLSMLLPNQPVFLASITVGDLFDEDALRASLLDRVGCDRHVAILRSGVAFEWAQPSTDADDPKAIGADASVSWCLGEESEAIVQGRKQGTAMRNGRWTDASRVRICKAEMAKLFGQVLELATPHDQLDQYANAAEGSRLSYYQLKQRAVAYQTAKRALYAADGALCGWIVNPPLLEEFDSQCIIP
ncbi:adenosine deaminase/editase [Entophlyctis helioformis]|nr:adenosine deaminase/editase [Entophlyctis helioformis]